MRLSALSLGFSIQIWLRWISYQAFFIWSVITKFVIWKWIVYLLIF